MTSAPFLLFWSSFNECSAQYCFQATGCFPKLIDRQRWERNESCHNDYHQRSEGILADPRIKPATSCSQMLHATDWAMGLDIMGKKSMQVTSMFLFPHFQGRSPLLIQIFNFFTCNALNLSDRWFDPRLGPYSFRILMIVIATRFIALPPLSVCCFDNGYVGKQPLALKEYCAESLLKELQESMSDAI